MGRSAGTGYPHILLNALIGRFTTAEVLNILVRVHSHQSSHWFPTSKLHVDDVDPLSAVTAAETESGLIASGRCGRSPS